jgi:hypothetical protein
MSTFLQLCQDLRTESGIPGTGPATVVGQTGMYGKLVGWVQEAYSEILRMHAWSFLWARATPTLIDGQAAYTGADLLITDLGRVYASKVFDTTDGLKRLYYQSWDRIDESPVVSGTPRYFTRRPDQALLFYPTPDDAYTLRLDYLREGSALSANGDVPIIPDAQLHKIIVYKALQYYALHDENQSALQHGMLQFNMLLSQMYSKYGPPLITAAVPLDQEPVASTAELV